MLDGIIEYVKRGVIPVLLAVIVGMLILGALHKYFPNNIIGQGADYIARLVNGTQEGL